QQATVAFQQLLQPLPRLATDARLLLLFALGLDAILLLLLRADRVGPGEIHLLAAPGPRLAAGVPGLAAAGLGFRRFRRCRAGREAELLQLVTDGGGHLQSS